jgi:hypothetical protein
MRPAETIELLVGGKRAAQPLFANLAWIVSRQPEGEREQTLSVLFSKAS